MKEKTQPPRGARWLAVCATLLLVCGPRASAQIRYSVPEEVKEGTVVGNVAKDLGLDVASLGERALRVVPDAVFEVNREDGALSVRGRVDREQQCPGSGACLMELELLLEHPLEIHRVVVEITDVNDNSPTFPESHQTFDIGELSSPGARLQLLPAHDPDAGVNSIRSYTLSESEYFALDVRESHPYLVLQKTLDRDQNRHCLLVTAADGGEPQRSATLNVTVFVVDTDNRPVFSKDVYEAHVQENAQVGTVVIHLSVSGVTGDVEYSLGETSIQSVHNMFQLNKLTGEMTVGGVVDFEETDQYELDIEASDKGTPPLTGTCKVIVRIIDINDNAPEIDVTSLVTAVSEDDKPGTVVSVIHVRDKDVGVNGKITAHITDSVPFELKSSGAENTYSLVLRDFLDREEVSQYDITIKASDCGEPPLSATKTLSIRVSDVNDNSPQFEQSPLYFYIVENNLVGAVLFSVTATDRDEDLNAEISYNIVRTGHDKDMASFLNVNAETGQIAALRSFDFETLTSFQFQVVASDSGTPSLSSSVTVHVFIVDQNDHAPVILYPVSSKGSAEGVEEVPHNVDAGYLVTKIKAYDPDVGYNGQLLFSLQEVTDSSLFGLNRNNGQIRTLRSITDTDEVQHRLVILVQDNGIEPLSATATVIVKVPPREPPAPSEVKRSTNVTVSFYLLIVLALVSVLLFLCIIALIAMQCSKSSTDTKYNGTVHYSVQGWSGPHEAAQDLL